MIVRNVLSDAVKRVYLTNVKKSIKNGPVGCQFLDDTIMYAFWWLTRLSGQLE